MRAIRSSGVFVVTILLVLSSGCVSRTPLRAIPEEQRSRAEVVYSPADLRASGGTVGTRSAKEVGSSGGLVGGVVMLIAGAVEYNRSDWMERIRESTGVFEPDLLVQKVTASLEALHGKNSDRATNGTVLYLRLTHVGLPELERAWYGAQGFAHARLVAPDGKEIWFADAQSTATKLRRPEDFKANPSLYKTDFVEVAEDLARQLVNGPIRVRREI